MLLPPLLDGSAHAAHFAGEGFLDRRANGHLRDVAGEHVAPRDQLRDVPLATRGEKPREKGQDDLEAAAHASSQMGANAIRATRDPFSD
ncbi:hypothetical protein [Opitutus sp. ER46]|uniref:hypothetical protein n=1 Tax=Opitutus sp. ER46 TaxID=2161864 RepID=UPI0011B21B46|nr:hypothetical protein [Opitutus sp. ER46]